ncbi:MAG: DNA topoisomerase (ATP-hydrolyzing) subunit A [Spirochaetaceae bacterium]|nr:DNA topoisomerase (ATP-hydrolyzing) subunit A [Spirochaetaceae bacterium]
MENEIKTPEGGTLITMPIDQEVKRAYIDYSMSVIVSRALPDVRDGMKPVHRRILYAMDELNLRNNGPTRKCAKIVGDVLGKYHPHGDASVYDALVRLGQDFSLRYPVVTPQGNFGTIAGDPAAAYRYTEAKMAKLAEEMVADIGKDTVDFLPNFDETTKEPTVLPAKFPFLLANGTNGIAVGMATNMPPHNLREIAAAVAAYIDNPEISIEELAEYMKGPDFPTGGIIYGRSGIMQAFKTGRGKITVRGRYVVEEGKNGRETIVFTEVPYQVNTRVLCERIGELARDKIIDGISGINDESSDRIGMRIVIDLKRGASLKLVLNQLFAKTPLQSSFNVINLALANGRPQIFNLKQLIEHFVNHRDQVITRRTKFDLSKALARAHILEAQITAINNIDEVISIIRGSRDTESAKNSLETRFNFDEVQAQAIVDMQLKKLTHLLIDDLKNEIAELNTLIEYLRDLLANHEKILNLIKTETNELAEKYGDERRTDIVAAGIDNISAEDIIKEEDVVVVISNLGYVKRMPVTTYRSQKRGGMGISGTKLVDDDFVKHIFVASTHDIILFITSAGRAYFIRAHEIPESSRNSRGGHLKSLLQLSEGEEITTITPLRDFSENQFIFMITQKGVAKRISTIEFKNARSRGVNALNFKSDDDKVISSVLTDGNRDILIITQNGKALRCSENSVRAMGRGATGVRGIELSDGDKVVSVISNDVDGGSILVVSDKGFGKRSVFDDFAVHGRGTSGQKIFGNTEGKGKIAGALFVQDSDTLMCVTNKGQIIRTPVSGISEQGRTASGVNIFTFDDDEYVISIDKASNEEAQKNDE